MLQIPEKLRPRILAIDIMCLVNKGSTLKQAFEHIAFLQLSDDAKPFVTFLVTQTIRYQNIFHHIIAHYLQKKPQNKSLEFVYTVLSMGACELLLSEQKPNITLSCYTDITKFDKKTNHLSGTIRAILGKIHTDIDILKPLLHDYKRVFGDDLYTHIQADYPDNADIICEWLLKEPMLDSLKLTDCPTPNGYLDVSTYIMRYKSGIRPENLGLFRDGDITIQSYASHLALLGAGDIAGKTVLDLCSAPGGKTIQAIAGKAQVTALDISEKRLEKLQQNLQRTGFSANVIVSDALDYKPDTLFDIVLLDAPCSATGTIRKNPDIIQNFDTENILKLNILQEKLLNHAASMVKPNGLLIYAVCSLSKSEGEAQILNFITHHTDFCVTLPHHSELLPDFALDTHNCVRLLPHYDSSKGGHDGFFIAYLTKNNLKQ